MNIYYRLADVSVDPVNDTLADRGRCPLKIFESWQMGIPVVTSDVGDRKILAGDPPAIKLAQPGSIGDLARKIQDVLDTRLLAEKLVTTGLQRSENYKWAVIAEAVSRKFLSHIYG